MNWSVEHSIIKTSPGVSNYSSAPIGIGHLATFGKYLIVNNIDHNSEISQLDHSALKPVAFYDQTIYANDPENAGFDLDIHAVLYDKPRKSLLMLNHFGRLRFFDSDTFVSSDSPVQMTVAAEALWVADVEQTLLVEDCLVSTSPGDYHVPGPAMPGLFVSSPFSVVSLKYNSLGEPQKLDYAVYFTELGYVTAIAVNSGGNLLAVGFGQNVIILKIDKKKNGILSLDDIVSQFKTNFYCRFLSFWEEKYLVSAGHAVEFEDNVYDPDTLKGGGFMVMNILNNQILSSIQFNCNLAWGNGGLCLTLAGGWTIDSDMLIIGVDRQANLWSWQFQKDIDKRLIASGQVSNGDSYGIGHLAWSREQLLCGFNRDGPRLHKYNFTRTNL